MKELAERLRYSVPQIRRYVKDRKIAALQPAGKGGKLFFSTHAVEAFLEPTRVPSDVIPKPRKTPGSPPPNRPG